MKRLIVSADDFGLTAGINEGIIRCARQGIVTSASIMTSTPAFESAVSRAKQQPGLATGVHLNLVKNKPLQPIVKVRSLVDNDGVFYTLPRFMFRLLSGRIIIAEAETELRNQIEKALAAGLKITHLDSHRHFHVYPSLLKLVIKLAKEYKISAIRCPLGLSIFPGSVKEFILSSLSRNARRNLDADNIIHNERFFELVKIEGRHDYLRVFQKFCETLPDGVTELDCHPGFITKELDGIEATIHNRERQVEILTNPAISRLLEKYEIKLVNYGDIS
jgi:chitin disaccharide deacetylase